MDCCYVWALVVQIFQPCTKVWLWDKHVFIGFFLLFNTLIWSYVYLYEIITCRLPRQHSGISSGLQDSLQLADDRFYSLDLHRHHFINIVSFNCRLFSPEFSQVCKSRFYHTRDFRQFRRHLFLSTVETIPVTLINCQLDFCRWGLRLSNSRSLWVHFKQKRTVAKKTVAQGEWSLMTDVPLYLLDWLLLSILWLIGNFS